ncbi:MAG: S9 family peptidase [Saprospiraceae bacterium]|jgi:oligopeptidase B|nr:S9 family peptidase [Saprospiraceae bacterium]
MKKNLVSKSKNSYCILLLIIIFAACSETQKSQKDQTNISNMYTKTDIEAPTCQKKPHEIITHGDKRIDNYYWLNQREDEEVLSYLKAENEYKDKMIAHLADLQENLFEEIKGRIKQTDLSVPYKDNGYFYFTKYNEGEEYPIYARKKGNLEAPEEVYMNVNKLAKPFDYYNVSGRSVSLNNELLAYGEDTLSRRIYTIRFKNLKTGEMLEDQIKNTSGSAVWANDNKTVFYTVKDKSLRSFKVFKHVLGTDSADDQEVFHETDETFSCYVYKTKSKKFIVIGSFQTVSTEYRVLNANTPNGDWQIIQPRERDLEYSIKHFEDKWFIKTNLDAKNFRLMSTPENATTKDNWKEVIPHRETVLLEGVDIFKEYLVLEERINGIRKLRIMPWEGKEHYIDFPEESYVSSTSVNLEFDTEILRISYTSLTTPTSIFDYNMSSKDRVLLKQQEVVGDFDPAKYQSERHFATASDGAKVPISLVYKKGVEKDGKAPLLLYGYGSYGASMDPRFSSVRLSLLDRGFIFAIAHIRGGEEMGRGWYEDGKLLNKKNTFTDFIDCGEYLIAENYTNKENLYAMGGSAGGLLMGAIINMRPDMWKGIVAAVPFVDVVTTMLDETIPLTTGEFDEWGNPKDPKYYDYIKSYSPYDNVEAKEYPAMLVTTGLHDSQVQYWEPAKWVAKLREMKTDNNPLIMRTNMDAGHGGQSGRFRRYKETAMEYAFILDLAGLAGIKG